MFFNKTHSPTILRSVTNFHLSIKSINIVRKTLGLDIEDN